MTDSETGSQHPARRDEPPPWAKLRRPGLTVLVVLAATAMPAIARLVAHTAVGDVRQPRPVAHRQIGGARRPLGSCDSGYCPALR